jgi:hypothetical protein
MCCDESMTESFFAPHEVINYIDDVLQQPTSAFCLELPHPKRSPQQLPNTIPDRIKNQQNRCPKSSQHPTSDQANEVGRVGTHPASRKQNRRRFSSPRPNNECWRSRTRARRIVDMLSPGGGLAAWSMVTFNHHGHPSGNGSWPGLFGFTKPLTRERLFHGFPKAMLRAALDGTRAAASPISRPI